MMDSSPLVLALAALAGIFLGILYFGGLWWTIQRISQSSQSVWLLAVSFILRTILIMGGFFVITNGKLERLAVSMLAFFVTRFFFIKYFQPQAERSTQTNGNQP
jgi:F1F0 ATPase subunit 2